MFVTHDVDEALALGDRVAVLGRHGLRTWSRASPRTEGVAREQLRDQILAALEAARILEQP